MLLEQQVAALGVPQQIPQVPGDKVPMSVIRQRRIRLKSPPSSPTVWLSSYLRPSSRLFALHLL